MAQFYRKLLRSIAVFVTLGLCLAGGATYSQEAPATAVIPSQALPGTGGAVSAVGPGDVLQITVYGQPDLNSVVTVDTHGSISAPFLGTLHVDQESPSTIARQIEDGLRRGGYLSNPTVSIEVRQVNSRTVSILGEIQRPGRYAITNRLSLLELLALAGGVKPDAGEDITVIRRSPDNGKRSQIEVKLNSKIVPSQTVQDLDLQSGDIIYVPAAPLFFTYGEVGKPGAYPMEQGMTVMRAISLAGGLTPRASDRSITIKRTDKTTGVVQSLPAKLTDTIQPGDVIHVGERWF